MIEVYITIIIVTEVSRPAERVRKWGVGGGGAKS